MYRIRYEPIASALCPNIFFVPKHTLQLLFILLLNLLSLYSAISDFQDIFTYLIMSQEENPQPQKKGNPPAAKPKNESQPVRQNQRQGGKGRQEREKRSVRTGYRLENLKSIQVTRMHQDIRGRAELMADINHALFGFRRFRRIELTCSLNTFFSALKVCSIFHRGVADLYMIVELATIHFTQFEDEKDTKGTEKQHSIFKVALTRYPSEADRKSYGFHEAFKAEDIKNPFRVYGRRRDTNNYRGDDRRGDRDYRNQRDRRQEADKERPRRRQYKREKDEYEDRPKQNAAKKSDNSKQYPDNSQKPSKSKAYAEKKEKQGKSSQPEQLGRSDRQDRREVPDKAGENDRRYQRGETRNRGAGRVAQHNYDSSHIKQEPERTEDRGERGPKRSKKYFEDENW